jgi:hypothetical protein
MDSNFQYVSAVNLVVAPLSRRALGTGRRAVPDRQSRTALAAQQFAERLSSSRVRQYDRRAERQERLAVPLGEADAIEQDPSARIYRSIIGTTSGRGAWPIVNVPRTHRCIAPLLLPLGTVLMTEPKKP